MTGMQAQEMNVDVIANNLANVNTSGFKRSRIDFEDLLYQTVVPPGASSSETTAVPTGIQVGMGTNPVAVHKEFGQGNLQITENPLDLAIEGDGFFQVTLPEGDVGYTRSGAFKRDQDGNLVTVNGYKLEPEITIPDDAKEVTVGADGTVSALLNDGTIQEIGTIELARFINPAGLDSVGHNIYKRTDASGDAITGTPGQEGLGAISSGFLEMSNVRVVEEMVNLITAQRAYEVNSKAIQASDEMLQMANNLTR